MFRSLDCTTCDRFYPTGKDGMSGQCRAKPPAPVMVGLQQTALGARPLIESHFPTVGKGQFCGEHPEAPKREEPKKDLEDLRGPLASLPRSGPMMPIVQRDCRNDPAEGDDDAADVANIETKGNA